MQLITKELRAEFPEWMSTDGREPHEVRIIAKFFDPTGEFTWYATEFDGEDTFFGLVDGFCRELGYFSLSELERAHGRFGLGIERDRYYGEHTLAEVMD